MATRSAKQGIVHYKTLGNTDVLVSGWMVPFQGANRIEPPAESPAPVRTNGVTAGSR